ncbi:MAG: hypothetical protein ACYCWW_05870, partial [Deltaproteobacteria bacterium]
TAWLGEHPQAPLPTAIYGVLLDGAAVAFTLLQREIVAYDHGGSILAASAAKNAKKGGASQLLYLAAIGLAFVRPWLSDVLYVVVALLWVVPDRHIEAAVSAADPSESTHERRPQRG